MAPRTSAANSVVGGAASAGSGGALDNDDNDNDPGANIASHENESLSSSVDGENATTRNGPGGRQQQELATELPSWFVVQLTITASLGGCLFGYDMGAISGTLPQLTQTFDLEDDQQQLVVSILYVGGVVGACIGGSLCDRMGRKAAILLTDVVFMMGAIWLYLASVYAEVVFGRFVVGVGVAVSGVADVSYLHECSPIEWRGSIVSANEACISLGFLLAYIAGYIYADEGAEEWRVVFGAAGILAAVQFAGMLVLPESPAWLMEKGRIEAANRAMERINGTTHCPDMTPSSNEGDGEDTSVFGWGSNSYEPSFLRLRRRSGRNRSPLRNSNGESEIEPVDSQSPLRDNDFVSAESDPFNAEEGTIRAGEETTRIHGPPNREKRTCLHCGCSNPLLKLRKAKLMLSRYRKQVVIALFLAVAQQFCGQTNILSYAPLIFSEAMKQDVENSGENANDANGGETKDTSMIIIGVVKLFVTVLVIWRIEYIGRRSLLILGNALIATGLLALGVAFGGSSNTAGADEGEDVAVSWSPMTNIKTFHLALPGVILVVCGYSMSFGPLTWLLTSEIFPTDIRGRALGYTTIVSYMCGAISTETFLFTQSILGPSVVFGMYCIVTVTGMLFAYLAIPDTGGKTVEQIDESLNRMSWWKYNAMDLLLQNDEGGSIAHDRPASSSRSEMVRSPSQLSNHSLT